MSFTRSAHLLRSLNPSISSSIRGFSDLPPLATFTKLSEGTPEDYRRTQAYFAKAASVEAMTERFLGMIDALRGVSLGNGVDMYDHSVQTATRALKDGADEETVVCALMHDVGEVLVPACHGEVAGSLLRPFISPKNYWILNHHEIFQAYYYGEAMNVDKNLRERFRDNEFFGACEEFCGRWDETAFDPAYESLPLSEFRPMVKNILSRKPYALKGLLEDELSNTKAALGVYDFEDWEAKN